MLARMSAFDRPHPALRRGIFPRGVARALAPSGCMNRSGPCSTRGAMLSRERTSSSPPPDSFTYGRPSITFLGAMRASSNQELRCFVRRSSMRTPRLASNRRSSRTPTASTAGGSSRRRAAACWAAASARCITRSIDFSSAVHTDTFGYAPQPAPRRFAPLRAGMREMRRVRTNVTPSMLLPQRGTVTRPILWATVGMPSSSNVTSAVSLSEKTKAIVPTSVAFGAPAPAPGGVAKGGLVLRNSSTSVDKPTADGSHSTARWASGLETSPSDGILKQNNRLSCKPRR